MIRIPITALVLAFVMASCAPSDADHDRAAAANGSDQDQPAAVSGPDVDQSAGAGSNPEQSAVATGTEGDQLAARGEVSSASAFPAATVYKTPTCGCCSDWVSHIEENGFEARTVDMPDVTPMRHRLGVPPDLTSCHTAVVGGYVVEGHVPARIIERMLDERPDITGIAVAGMPTGSPGMEVPGRAPQPYEVIAFDRRGRRYVFEAVGM